MRDQYFVILLTAALVMGCQGQVDVADHSDVDNQISETTPESNDGDSNNVVTNSEASSDADSTKSPSTPSQSISSNANLNSRQAKDIPSADASPSEVCQAFLRLLQEDNTSQAQKLFTRKAMSLTLRTDLPLGFPGQADATFDVAEAKFATAKRKLCQVMSTISETVDGEKLDTQLGWMLRKEHDGWRICGMMLPATEGNPMDFLSFESTKDIIRVKMMLSGQPSVQGMQASN